MCLVVGWSHEMRSDEGLLRELIYVLWPCANSHRHFNVGVDITATMESLELCESSKKCETWKLYQSQYQTLSFHRQQRRSSYSILHTVFCFSLFSAQTCKRVLMQLSRIVWIEIRWANPAKDEASSSLCLNINGCVVCAFKSSTTDAAMVWREHETIFVITREVCEDCVDCEVVRRLEWGTERPS